MFVRQPPSRHQVQRYFPPRVKRQEIECHVAQVPDEQNAIVVYELSQIALNRVGIEDEEVVMEGKHRCVEEKEPLGTRLVSLHGGAREEAMVIGRFEG